MGALQPEHLLLILVIVLIVFGAGRLPQTLGQIGKGVRTFRDEAAGTSASQAPAATATPAASATGAFCKNCGKPLAADAKFCANCGTAV